MEKSVATMCVVILAFMCVHSVYSAPRVVKTICNPNRVIGLEVRGAMNLYVKINNCTQRRFVNTNARTTLTFCQLDWDTLYIVTFTTSSGSIADSQGIWSIKCDPDEAPVANVEFTAEAFTYTTAGHVAGVIAPEVFLVVLLANGSALSEVGGAVNVGDPLYLDIYLAGSFDGKFSIQVKTLLLISGGYRLTLAGGPNSNGDGCPTSDANWPAFMKESETHHRAVFQAFNPLPNKGTAATLTYRATVNVCYHPSYTVDECMMEGCSALLPSGRKKRDTGTGTGTGTVGSEVIEASTSFIIRPSDETGSTDTGSGTTGDNGQSSVGGQVEEQKATPVCEVCMQRSVLYGLIGFFIPALLLSFAASVCLFIRERRRRKIVEEKEIVTIRSNNGDSVRHSFRS